MFVASYPGPLCANTLKQSIVFKSLPLSLTPGPQTFGLYVRLFPSSLGTTFGAVLDMVTDRCATTCLIIVLGFFYPKWLFMWQVLVALDIGSHWVQMYMSLLHGETTHKVTDLSANPIMRLYYSRVSKLNFIHVTSLFHDVIMLP